ncbi:MAG: aldehyde dehydrogenase family protein [Candidatus Dormiibacterota bacterium]
MSETATSPLAATEAALADLHYHSGKVLIDGEIRDPLSGKTQDQVFPGNGQVIGQTALADAKDVDAAVAAARKALEGDWGALNARDRRRLLLRYAQLIEEHKEELGKLQTIDVGMPIGLSGGWILGPEMTADFFEFYAGLVDKAIGEVLPAYPNAALDYTLREPLGVVACITAWNAPVYLYGAKVAPALAAGNTVVVKPSEVGAASTLLLGELATEAGIPAGVVNVISGLGQECGEPLVKHDGVDAISFTGGTATGRRIASMAAEGLKRTVLELGGKSANIVFEDGDVGLGGALSAGMITYGTSGQYCAAATRALVHRSKMDQFLESAVGVLAFMQPGDPFNPATMAGPMISERQLERVLGYIEKGKEEGAQVHTGGGRMAGGLEEGYYVEPTILLTSNDTTPAREEIFGPVLSAIPFDDEDEAIRLANDSPFGLAAVITTSDLKRAHRVAAKLKTGTVGINGYSIGASMPFGGVKQSGYGREGSARAIDDFSYIKNVYVELQ